MQVTNLVDYLLRIILNYLNYLFDFKLKCVSQLVVLMLEMEEN